MCSVLVLDLDDTLFPEKQFVLSGFQEIDRFLLERGYSGFFAEARRLFDSGIRGDVFDRVLRSLGVMEAAQLIPELIKIYREHAPTLQLHKDADWTLRFFHKRNQLGLITDGYLLTQKNKVKALGIAHYFDAVVYSDEFGRDHWKPSPTPYMKLKGILGCDHRNCVYVADNPKKDFVTPNKLGWRTIQICRPDGEYAFAQAPLGFQAQEKISTLQELQALIT